MPFDPNALTPEMKISVTLGEFHNTHESAGKILQRMRVEGLSTWTKGDLENGLERLRAAQRLTDAEDGDDDGGMQYYKEINLFRAEIVRR